MIFKPVAIIYFIHAYSNLIIISFCELKNYMYLCCDCLTTRTESVNNNP